MIDIEDLFFQYGESGFHLSVPRLSVPAATAIAFVGPSGSGKSTLLHLLAGIRVASRGRVSVGGVELATLADAARRNFRISHVGQVFQDFELLEYLNVQDNILLPYRINRRLHLTPDVRARARQLAAAMGLEPLLRRHPERLSQGERQRVALCRAMLPGPRLILADEPTGNLDPAAKQQILGLLLDQARRTAATLVTVTHDHGLLEHFDEVFDFEQLSAAPP